MGKNRRLGGKHEQRKVEGMKLQNHGSYKRCLGSVKREAEMEKEVGRGETPWQEGARRGRIPNEQLVAAHPGPTPMPLRPLTRKRQPETMHVPGKRS